MKVKLLYKQFIYNLSAKPEPTEINGFFCYVFLDEKTGKKITLPASETTIMEEVE
jgi:hypothetical protein